MTIELYDWSNCEALFETCALEVVKEDTCCICGAKKIGFGNNPAPAKMIGRCCDECNKDYVLPYRGYLIGKNKGELPVITWEFPDIA